MVANAPRPLESLSELFAALSTRIFLPFISNPLKCLMATLVESWSRNSQKAKPLLFPVSGSRGIRKLTMVPTWEKILRRSSSFTSHGKFPTKKRTRAWKFRVFFPSKKMRKKLVKKICVIFSSSQKSISIGRTYRTPNAIVALGPPFYPKHSKKWGVHFSFQNTSGGKNRGRFFRSHSNADRKFDVTVYRIHDVPLSNQRLLKIAVKIPANNSGHCRTGEAGWWKKHMRKWKFLQKIDETKTQQWLTILFTVARGEHLEASRQKSMLSWGWQHPDTVKIYVLPFTRIRVAFAQFQKYGATTHFLCTEKATASQTGWRNSAKSKDSSKLVCYVSSCHCAALMITKHGRTYK